MNTTITANLPVLDEVCRLVGFSASHAACLAEHGADLACADDAFGHRYFGFLLEAAPPLETLTRKLGPALRALIDGQQRHHEQLFALPLDAAAQDRAAAMGRIHGKLGLCPSLLAGLSEVHVRAVDQALHGLRLDAAVRGEVREAARRRIQIDLLMQVSACRSLASNTVSAPAARALPPGWLAELAGLDTALTPALLCDSAQRHGMSLACYALPGAHRVSGAQRLLPDAALRAALDAASAGQPWHGEGALCVGTPGPAPRFALLAAGLDNDAQTLAQLKLVAALLGNPAQPESQASERLTYVSQHDLTTALPNRQRLLELIDALQVPARWLIVVALDGFHELNARLGHAQGDELLRQCARRLDRLSRHCGGTARIGAARFAVYGDSAREAVDAVLERVVAALTLPIKLGIESVELSVSAGIVVDKGERSDASAMLRRADLALIRARQSGGGGWHYYDEAMDIEIRRLHKLRADFALALEAGELALFYQPKINLVSHRVTGVEALVRWRQNGRFVPPGVFFPAIETCDLMRRLDAWVLAEAVASLARWQSAGRKLSMSVNVSALSLKHESFLPLVEGLLEHHTLESDSLEIEVLETLSQQEASQIAGKLSRCRELGLRVALDDFGTCASSLVHLQQLPFDTIKIDQRFVRILIDSPENEAIIRSMVAYAGHTRRRLVAEGIESQAIWQRLLELGCEDGQGYEISPPMSAETLELWLEDWRCSEEVAA